MNDTNHAVQNANGWADSIRSMVAALECDFDRLEELREERADLVQELESTSAEHSPHGHSMAKANLDAWDMENMAELHELAEAATVDGDEMKDADDVRERIQESPLSVEVRSGWCASKADMTPEEFCILLSTGGPALRIMGELDEHGQPSRAWLEYQDWGTPWTHHYVEGLADALLTFAQQFYFGE
jgi:hypothetical protein